MEKAERTKVNIVNALTYSKKRKKKGQNHFHLNYARFNVRKTKTKLNTPTKK